jgi:hypothetical protein
MSFFEEGNFIIIHGGRSDENENNFALYDTYLLELSKLEWIQVELFQQNVNESKVFNRCGHSSVIYGIFYR